MVSTLDQTAGAPEQLLTVPEVARRFRCRVETVRRWIAKGVLPAHVLPSGEYRIREQDLSHVFRPTDSERR